MLPETILLIGGGSAVVLLLLILAIGIWSQFDGKPKSSGRTVYDIDVDPSPYQYTPRESIEVAIKELEEVAPTQDSMDEVNSKISGAYSDEELLALVLDRKYGKIINEDLEWIEMELSRRLVYGEIKKATKKEKALLSRIESLFRGTN